MTNLRSNFTKTGFTKSGFGCCSHFKKCEMGKLACVYEDTDAEVKQYCAAYQRSKKEQSSVIYTEPVLNNLVADKKVESKTTSIKTEEQQLSLF